MADLLIKNGLVYDGTGCSPQRSDIRIRGNRITEIKKDLVVESDDRVLDASGLAVTPGFVDIHRHYDQMPFRKNDQNYGEVLLRQGITTAVTGNCGISAAPQPADAGIRRAMKDYYAPVLGDFNESDYFPSFPSYLEALKSASLPVNTAAAVGMGAIRISVNGFSDERLTENQLARCRQIVSDALKAGACGVSLGLMYLPECYETVEELGEILKPAGKAGKTVSIHIRGEGDSLVKSVSEAIAIGRAAGCRIEISHFKSCGLHNWHKEIYTAISLIQEAQERGQEVYCDFYPYNCASTTLMSLVPPAFVQGDIEKMIKRLKTAEGRTELRRLLAKVYPDWDNYILSLGWDKITISSGTQKECQKYIGMTIPEIAAAFHYSDEPDVLCDLLIKDHGNTAIVLQSMCQEDVDTVARLPYSCVISDAIYADTENPHPRMYGAFPKVISDYVKNRSILSLEEAIHKMTLLPASRMNLSGIGAIKEGFYADLNLFDPAVFTDKSTYQQGKQLAQGLRWCILNGNIAVEDDTVLSLNRGRLIL